MPLPTISVSRSRRYSFCDHSSSVLEVQSSRITLYFKCVCVFDLVQDLTGVSNPQQLRCFLQPDAR